MRKESVGTFAGIGSREVPSDTFFKIKEIAYKLACEGWTCRSGGANGCDTAFEYGVSMAVHDSPNEIGGIQIFLPTAKIPDWAMKTVEQYHPAPHNLNPFAKRLHARNAQIILGENGDDPVDFVLCWTYNGRETGGTSQALRIARDNDIPIFNLGNTTEYQRWLKFIGEI